MGLQKQLVPIQFGGGIDTKPDPKQLQAGKLLTLQNAQFSKGGQLNKRYGYSALNRTIEGGGQISAGVAIANYQDQLIMFDGNNIYSYLTATGNWSNRGTAISITTTDTDIIRLSAAQQLNPDMAYCNGIEVYAWEDSRGGVRYSVLDTVTKAFALSDSSLNTSGQQPKCITYGSYIYIFYMDGANTLWYQQINPLNPTVVQSKVSVATDCLTNHNGAPYDVHIINGNIYIGYLSSSTGSGAIQLFYIDVNLDVHPVTVVNNTVNQAINTGFQGAINVVGDSGNNVWISWANGVDVRTACYSQLLASQVLASTLVDTCDVRVLCGIESPTALTLLLHYEVHATAAYNEQVRYTTITQGAVVGSAMTIRSVGLMTKAFKYGGNIYVNTCYQSTLQSTDFCFLIAQGNTILSTPVIIAKFTAGVGGGLQTNNMCPEIVTISTGLLKFGNNQAGKIISEANTLFTLYGVNSSSMNFITSDNFISTVQANTLLIAGGILQGYDGISATELGFHLYPENVTAVATNSPSGSLSTGSYQYIVEFEWTDNNGQIHRSAPSVPVTVQVTAGQSVNLAGPMLRLTAKKTAISIVIYRTQANGSTFNRVTSTIAPTLNSVTSDAWSFNDVLSDTIAAGNELNYTTGGILANNSPPANAIIATYGDRVFLAGLADKLLLWYSQTVVDNSNSNTIPPQFCQELTISCDPRGGDISALGLLNQVLIIFKQNNIFVLQGNGPDATGNNSDYGDPTLITSDVGCININSVVITPQGLMFQSAKGIYLLDQSLTLTYIGAPVEAYNSYVITSSTLNNSANQIIFTTTGGIALVYDYYFDQWSVWTNHYAVDSIIYNNTFTYLAANGIVYQQSVNAFTDAGSPILMSFTLPNLAFAGLQGYQRVFRCFILGSYKGPHTLTVNVAYDYNDNYTQSTTITPTSPSSYWGSDSNWGSGSVWGGAGYQIYEFRVDFAIQKCTAIRLYISDNQTSNYNEGYAISSIVFEVGVLPGGNKLPLSNTYGAK